jgi:hypothetical protein
VCDEPHQEFTCKPVGPGRSAGILCRELLTERSQSGLVIGDEKHRHVGGIYDHGVLSFA